MPKEVKIDKAAIKDKIASLDYDFVHHFSKKKILEIEQSAKVRSFVLIP